MNHIIFPPTNIQSLHWLTRLHSLVVNSAFLVFLFLMLTNEDQPQGPARWVVMVIGCAIGCSLAAWRWPKEGGIATCMAGLALMTAAFYSSLFFGGRGLITFVVPFLMGVPFVMAGLLFWQLGQTKVQQ
jgi:hypothetical protein